MTQRSRSPGDPTRKPGVYVAVLRGVNVGGKNKVAMSTLATLFLEAGCKNVRTYIQSGNVVFTASPAAAARIPAGIARKIDESLGLRVPVVLRSSAELDRVVRENPYLRSGIEQETLHVAFLADEPSPARVKALDPDRSPGDCYQVSGRHIYLCCPNGVGRSKLTNAYFDSKLATTSTVRNWRTVVALAEMARASR